MGTTEAAAAWARGPPLLWDHEGPHRMAEGASLNLELPRPPPHGRGGLHHLGTTQAHTACRRGLGDPKAKEVPSPMR